MSATPTRAERVAAYKAKAFAFNWEIDDQTDEFVATAAGEEYRLPLALTFRDVEKYQNAEADDDIERLRILLAAAGRTEVLDRLKAVPIGLMAAILDEYGQVLAEVQDASLPE